MKGNTEKRGNKEISVNQRSLYYNCYEINCQESSFVPECVDSTVSFDSVY